MQGISNRNQCKKLPDSPAHSLSPNDVLAPASDRRNPERHAGGKQEHGGDKPVKKIVDVIPGSRLHLRAQQRVEDVSLNHEKPRNKTEEIDK